ncbi:MAG: FAD-dependent thymidylate synthase [Patescibacteria group bacterium]
MGVNVMQNFTESEEALIRAFIFTNPGGDISFVYPQSLIAGEELSPLMSAYSRTHVPMQERVLQFLDKEKTEQTRAMLPHIKPLMEIFRNPDGSLALSRRTTNFNEEFVLLHGHSSIKEETSIFGHVENVSDITMKKITGHPLCRPQVKSTRYLSYKSALDLALEDVDIVSLPNAEKFIEYLAFMNRRYLEVSDQLTDFVEQHPDTTLVVQYLSMPEQVEKATEKRFARQKKGDLNYTPSTEEWGREREKVIKSLDPQVVRKDIAKFVLDSSRVYLTAANRTSLGFSVDARTLEEIISGLISSPRQEDRMLGAKLWEEAKKIAPTLLGERSHVRVSPWMVHNEDVLRSTIGDLLKDVLAHNRGGRFINLITPQKMNMYSDRYNAALVAFVYSDASLEDIYEALTDKTASDILEKAHEMRGSYDILHPSISHGGLIVEMVSAYHGYRDMYRHRRGSRSVQLLTTRLGFETPELLVLAGVADDYERDMKHASTLYEEARAVSVHTAEKLVPFGALCRALHSWQPDQIGYVGRLRSFAVTGNMSYVNLTRELIAEVAKIMPQTASYFRYDTSEYPAHLWKAGYGWYDAERRGKV